MKNKKTLDELTKCKRIYSGELLIIAFVLLILGILFLTSVIKVADWKKWLFTILTLLGGIWAIVDFIWTIKSPKRRMKSALIDKILLLPNAIVLIVLDIYGLVNLCMNSSWTGNFNFNYFSVVIGSTLIYVSLVYFFEGFYHYKHIHPLIYEMMEDDKKEKEKKEGKDKNLNSQSKDEK